jgi:hypothetical protein
MLALRPVRRRCRRRVATADASRDGSDEPQVAGNWIRSRTADIFSDQECPQGVTLPVVGVGSHFSGSLIQWFRPALHSSAGRHPRLGAESAQPPSSATLERVEVSELVTSD